MLIIQEDCFGELFEVEIDLIEIKKKEDKPHAEN